MSAHKRMARGLCTGCAAGLASAVAGHPADAEYLDLLLMWQRCEDCEEFNLDAMATAPPSGRLWAHLCPPCAADARDAAEAAYPDLLPFLHAEVNVTDDGGPREEAFWAHHQAETALFDAFAQIVKEWPRCEDCPAVVSPPKPKEAQKPLGDRVLDFLAVHGTVNGGDLVNGVRGVTNNNVRKVTEPLREAGTITIEKRGVAKFYSLTAA